MHLQAVLPATIQRQQWQRLGDRRGQLQVQVQVQWQRREAQDCDCI